MTFTDKYELEGIGEEDGEEDEDESSIYQRRDRLLNRFATGDMLKTKFLKKYIHYAKSRIDPVVTKDASDEIIDFYTELRSQHSGDHNTLPVTVRTLETIIRLSSAHAKCRLSSEVEAEDVGIASALMRAAIFSETYSSTKDNHNRERPTPAHPGQKDDEEEGQSDNNNDHNDDDDDDDDGQGSGMAVDKESGPDDHKESEPDDRDQHESPAKRQRTEEPEQPEEQNVPEGAAGEADAMNQTSEPPKERTFNGPRDAMLTSTLIRMFTADDDIISITPAQLLAEGEKERAETSKRLKFHNMHNPFEAPFSEQELMPLLEFLSEEHRIMLDEGKIYKLV